MYTATFLEEEVGKKKMDCILNSLLRFCLSSCIKVFLMHPTLNVPHIHASYLTIQTFLEAVVLINICKDEVISRDEHSGRR